MVRSRSISPPHAQLRIQLSDIASTSSTAGVHRAPSATNPDDDDLVDPREIDKVLSEAAGMSGRWGLFRKFLHDRLKVIFPHPDQNVFLSLTSSY